MREDRKGRDIKGVSENDRGYNRDTENIKGKG
jgi:hypothetical protein